MNEAYTRIREGLEQAIARAAGEPVAVVLHRSAGHPAAAEPNEATQARLSTGLSEAEFAKALRVSPRTLRQWEQGRRKPSGTAQALLKILARHPEVLSELGP
jgi:putative transcriptional regulator